jgi:tetratricopeptide (TPR) repeat protein
LCHEEEESLGVSNNVTPFWRRLQESFRYPINFDSLLLIIGLSILTAVAAYMPFSILINLLLTSALLKYSFSCLDNTSHGILKAPDMNDAYGGGFGLALQVIFMVIVVIAVIWATSYFIGNMLASIVAIILIAGFPAMMINFAMSEDLFEALNPLKMINLMSSIGLPYGLLLAFIMIMTGSVSVISQIIGSDFSMITTILQSIVSNYYTIVIFHIMGYMIYQFQDELGFESSAILTSDVPQKSVLENNLTHIDILLKEGDFDEATRMFSEIIKTYPDEGQLKYRYFELLIATHNSDELNKFASDYLMYLLKSNREDQISFTYKRILKLIPQFKPDTPELRVKLANICQQNGDVQSVIKLINGIHKDYPNYENIVDAYELMYNALILMPKLKKQAQMCRLLIEKLQK